MLSAFAGWLLNPGRDAVLIANDTRQAEITVQPPARVGYDRIGGYLTAGLNDQIDYDKDLPMPCRIASKRLPDSDSVHF